MPLGAAVLFLHSFELYDSNHVLTQRPAIQWLGGETLLRRKFQEFFTFRKSLVLTKTQMQTLSMMQTFLHWQVVYRCF